MLTRDEPIMPSKVLAEESSSSDGLSWPKLVPSAGKALLAILNARILSKTLFELFMATDIKDRK
jgi:hypothetical protein